MERREVIVVGGGLAGLSAAIYLGRALRDTLVIEAGHSMAVWEPQVENYLGFPEGIGGEELLARGQEQVERYGVDFAEDTVESLARKGDGFELSGRQGRYQARRVLIATGIFHIPPDIPGVAECLGHSLFFCKDCDGLRARGKRIVVIGNNNQAVEYSLGMLPYSSCVMIATNQDVPLWDDRHAAWLQEYAVPVHAGRIVALEHIERRIQALCFDGGRRVAAEAIFATRGDVVHNALARSLGAEVDAEGQVVVDADMMTSVPGLYAAGCVTPANCQMIIAAGQGATAAQAINRSLFEESLRTHSLRQYRAVQLAEERTLPEVLE